jgi:tRNA threonylcarbamoyladenosine biosynthesis protein TsaB
MRVLGVDTATFTASAAIVENGRLVAEEMFPAADPAKRDGSPHVGGNHTEIILPLIQSVLESAAMALADISGLAVSIGPGSFTGLRIGLSTIKGIAYGWEVPVFGFSTLLANAMRVKDYDGLVCSFLDARKKQVYAALFRCRGDNLIRITEDSIQNADDIIDLVRSFNGDNGRPCLFIGDGTTAYEKLLRDAFGDGVDLRKGDSLPSVASAVAWLGERRCCDKAPVGLETNLAPIYLRPSEAEVKQKKIS